MSLINKLSNKSIEESIDLLCAAYEEKQASHLKESKSDSIMSGLSNYFKEMSPELKYSLLFGALGAGAGGLGMAGSNLIKNKKITLRDLLYGSLLGAVPGASAGYLMSGYLPDTRSVARPQESPAAQAKTDAQYKFEVDTSNQMDKLKKVMSNPGSDPIERSEARLKLIDLEQKLNPNKDIEIIKAKYPPVFKTENEMQGYARAHQQRADEAKALEAAKASQKALEESNRIADTGNRGTLIQNLDINQKAREAAERENKIDAADAAKREMERIAKNRAAMSGAGSVDDINKAYEQFKSKSKK